MRRKPRDVYFDDDATAPVAVVEPVYFDDPPKAADDGKRESAEMLFKICALISKGPKKNLPVRMAALEIVAGYESRSARAVARDLDVSHMTVLAAVDAIKEKLNLPSSRGKSRQN
jgi:hypothetical protein